MGHARVMHSIRVAGRGARSGERTVGQVGIAKVTYRPAHREPESQTCKKLASHRFELRAERAQVVSRWVLPLPLPLVRATLGVSVSPVWRCGLLIGQEVHRRELVHDLPCSRLRRLGGGGGVEQMEEKGCGEPSDDTERSFFVGGYAVAVACLYIAMTHPSLFYLAFSLSYSCEVCGKAGRLCPGVM
ncbi:hypothetical protein EDB83DRAFT_1156864 [Lactarius deliciosus]|nr:hypothetical protein EDB83DRAFT_1156864 [Lactarius deliciosus]